jgi:hypothetical protein
MNPKKEDYTIELVEPPKAYRKSGEIYKNIISEILEKPTGWYRVTIPDRKPNSVYTQLSKKIKENVKKEYLALHKINKEVFLEKKASK